MGHDQKYVDKNYEVVGTRFNRPDGIDKVTGKRDMAQMRVLRVS